MPGCMASCRGSTETSAELTLSSRPDADKTASKVRLAQEISLPSNVKLKMFRCGTRREAD